MPDPEDKPNDAQGAPSATVDGDQQGIVDSRAEWKRAIDSISDPALKEALSKKLEGYDRVLTKKTQELSKREQEIAQVAENLKAAVAKPTGQSVGQKMKILDAQIESTTDPATREGLRQLKDAIREESEDRLKELEARWEKRFEESKFVSQSNIKTSLVKDLKALEEIYGEDLIDKYKDGVEQNSLRYPGAHSPDQWLHSIVPADELRQALRIRLKNESKKTNGQDAQSDKRSAGNPAITRPIPSSEQYKGKNIREAARGFDRAIGDSVKAGLSKLGLNRRE